MRLITLRKGQRIMEDDEGDYESRYSRDVPLAERVALVNEDDDEDDHRAATAVLHPVVGAKETMEQRLAYTLNDNRHYYSLCSMFVVTYAHVVEGKPLSSLFLPHADTNVEFDF